MEITVNRLKHSLAVANKMKKIAQEHYEEYKVSPDDAFVLGMIHDIGYEFSEQQQEHANKGGLILKEQGYKYWKEVYYHGVSQREFDFFKQKKLPLITLGNLIYRADTALVAALTSVISGVLNE